MTVLSIDIGGTNFRTGAVREDGSVVKFEKVPTPSVFTSDDVLADLACHLKAFAEGLTIDAVAIGFPATLDRERKRVVQAPNIPFMEDLPVCDYLEEALGVPVVAERDVTFALCHDAAKYSIPDEGLVCGIYFGTGIGNAFLLDGKPLTGRHGAAGELGHIPVPGCTIPCGCGNVGCLEAVAGGKALARLQKEHFPETGVGDMFAEHSDDPAVIELVERMASAVTTEVNILDPDCVLLGGGVLNMKGFPRGLFEDFIRRQTRKPFPLNDLKLIYTEDEPYKSVVGGAIYARRKLAGRR